jgi:hypothetical protein
MLVVDELADLAADIMERGQLQPIILDSEGRILDGRNRLAACRLAGVEPALENYIGGDPAGYALSVNVNRRHLTKGQRAMATAMVYPDPEKPRPGQSLKTKDCQVSSGLLSQARTVLRKAPDLAAEVLAGGGMSLGDAYDTVRFQGEGAKNERVRTSKLRVSRPDLADAVDEGTMSLSEAEAQAKHDADMLKQQRWAATINLIDGVRLFDNEPELGAEMAASYSSAFAAEHGEDVTPARVRRAIAFLETVAATMEADAAANSPSAAALPKGVAIPPK